MRILMVASEANPLAKTGGLADVVYSLSKSLAKKHEVAIFMPFYQSVHKKLTKEAQKVAKFNVVMSWRNLDAEVFCVEIENVHYYLLKNDQYFNRENLYSYDDDNERFAYFTLAAKEFLKQGLFDPELIHLHDWQPGMLPVLIKEENDPKFSDIKFVLTIHNPAFRGYFDSYQLGDYYNLSDKRYIDGTIRLNNLVSTLKAAIMYSNKITTVSPTHRLELLNDTNSSGLNSVLELRKDDFVGILNGIDIEEFSPSKDSKIIAKYNKSNFIVKKKQNKEQLQLAKDLINDDAPLFGMVSRLTWQKGLDILLPNLRYILSNGGKVIILGSGESKYEQALEQLRSEFPRNLSIYIGYNDALAHQIYASCDFFLMPSLFEPCGLSQMISLRYATLPIVRMVGGLSDSIIPYIDGNINKANGFGFFDYSENALKDTIKWCYKVYENKDDFVQLQVNALNAINNWTKASKLYLKLYESII